MKRCFIAYEWVFPLSHAPVNCERIKASPDTDSNSTLCSYRNTPVLSRSRIYYVETFFKLRVSKALEEKPPMHPV